MIYQRLYLARTQTTHNLEYSTHKIEGQLPKKGASWVLGR